MTRRRTPDRKPKQPESDDEADGVRSGPRPPSALRCPNCDGKLVRETIKPYYWCCRDCGYASLEPEGS